MHKISKFKTVDKEIEKVYKTVMDIKSYSEFLPWCEKIKIISEDKERGKFLQKCGFHIWLLMRLIDV